MIHRPILLSLILLACHQYVVAQSILDSMRASVVIAPPDTNKVKLLLQLGDSLHDTEPRVALDHAKEALDLANKLDWHPLTARIEEMIGYTNNRLSNYSEALVHLHRSIPLHNANGDSIRAAAMNWHLSRIYGAVGDTARERKHMLQYLEHAKRKGDPRYIAEAYRGAGYSFGPADPERAMLYFRKALETAEAAGNLHEVCISTASIGSLLADMKEYDRAIEELDRALVIAQQIDFRSFETWILLKQATALGQLGRRPEAIRCRKRALQLAEESKDKLQTAQIHQALGMDLSSSGQISEALRHLRISKQLALELKMLSLETSALRGLILAHQKAGRADSALRYLEPFLANKDSLDRSDQRQEVVRLTAQMEYRNRQLADSLVHAGEIQQIDRDRTIERLRADRNRNRAIVVSGVAALLALIALLLYRSMRSRQRLARQQKELHDKQVDQLLAQQELKSINAMLEGQEIERDRMGRDLHDRLGSMLGGIKANMAALEDRAEAMRQDQQYQKVNRLLDQTVSELRQISHDMAAATLNRFGLEKALKDLRDTLHISGRLHVELNTFSLDQRLERSVEIALYRIVQELVSNVLKHANASELVIAVTRAPGRLSVVVSDNGVGFDVAQQNDGMGLSNVRSRAAALAASVQVDSTPGKGTTVSVECPVVE